VAEPDKYTGDGNGTLIRWRLEQIDKRLDKIEAGIAKANERSFDFWVKTLAGPLIIALVVLAGQLYLATHVALKP
jgi:hypothetical protein